MFCGNCGQRIADDAVICPACGTPTGVQPAKEEPAVQPADEKTVDSNTERLDYAVPEQQKQPGYQQPSYGTPAQPNYQQPNYGAPARPAYGQPNYGAPARPAYGQPNYGAPARPVYGTPVNPGYQAAQTAPKSSGTLSKIGHILAIILSAAAFAAMLVGAIVWIVDMVQNIVDLGKAKSYLGNDAYRDSLITFILFIVDNVIRVLSLLVIAILCLRKKATRSGAAGAWIIVFTVPTLVFLASSLFKFKLFGVRYQFDTVDTVLAFVFLATVIMFLITMANKSANQKVGIILGLITCLLLVTSLILTIVVYSENIKPVNDYISSSKLFGGEVPNAVAKTHTEYVFCFLAMLFTILTMTVVTITGKFLKKDQKQFNGYAR